MDKQTHEAAVHDAIKRALAEAGVKSEVLIGMCIEVGLEAYQDALAKSSQSDRPASGGTVDG